MILVRSSYYPMDIKKSNQREYLHNLYINGYDLPSARHLHSTNYNVIRFPLIVHTDTPYGLTIGSYYYLPHNTHIEIAFDGNRLSGAGDI